MTTTTKKNRLKDENGKAEEVPQQSASDRLKEELAAETQKRLEAAGQEFNEFVKAWSARHKVALVPVAIISENRVRTQNTIEPLP